MKMLLLLLIISYSAQLSAQENRIEEGAIDSQTLPDTIMRNGQIIYLYPDENAQFPGGTAALVKYLSENIRFPSCGTGINGKCYLELIIQTNGKVTDVLVARKVPDCPECDKEAVRVAKNMPDWIPAKKDGLPVASRFSLPIRLCF